MLASLGAGVDAWLWPGLTAAVAVAATLLAYRLALALARRLTKPEGVARTFLEAASPALGTFFALLTLNASLEISEDLPLLAQAQHLATLLLVIAATWVAEVQHSLTLLLIISMTWVAVSCTSAIGELIVRMNPADGDRWRYARKLETQTRFLVRSLNIVLVIMGLGVALMTFDTVRQLGASLLASAGIGGIILGFAARPVLRNLLAGMGVELTSANAGQRIRSWMEGSAGDPESSAAVPG